MEDKVAATRGEWVRSWCESSQKLRAVKRLSSAPITFAAPAGCDTFPSCPADDIQHSNAHSRRRRFEVFGGGVSRWVGVVAQLVERLVRNEKVRGSTPLGSTILKAFERL
jgi:hypothetical protein